MSAPTSPAAARLASDGSTQWLPLNYLIVDPAVQRPLDETRAETMASNLDLSLLGIITVSKRGDGSYHVVDGQHRVHALRVAGFGADQIECRVYEGLDRAKEAALFHGLNTFAKPHVFDLFLVRVVEGDPVACGIDRILMEFGWKLARGTADGSFAAVQAAERVYTGSGTTQKELGPLNLRSTIGTITEAWGHKVTNGNGIVVGGLGLFFARYGADIDNAALVRRLARFPGGADNFVGKARGLREFRGGTLPRCVGEVTTDLYNKGRTSRRLEDWR